jgi:signal transduction histidine kinase/ABC-type nitrate/sulfonate/bicarbonate transport system substrate-binding protein
MMEKSFTKFIFILSLFLFPTIIDANEVYLEHKLTHIDIQLKWKHQFQFAGFYIAKEKGYYNAKNLDVDLKELENINPMEAVLKKDLTFGIDDSTLNYYISHGSPLIMLFAIYQHSPLRLISLAENHIFTVQDLENKRIELPEYSLNNTAIDALLRANEIEAKQVDPTFSIQNLIDKKSDLISGYVSNEPFLLKSSGYKVNMLDPKQYGFDYYGDIFFTSQKTLRSHPRIVKDVYEASRQGWIYAFNHIDETVDLIYNKYNTQHKSKEALYYEAQELQKLVGDINDFGRLDITRLQDISNTYRFLLPHNYSKKNMKQYVYPQNQGMKKILELEYDQLIHISTLIFITFLIIILLIFLKITYKLKKQKELLDITEEVNKSGSWSFSKKKITMSKNCAAILECKSERVAIKQLSHHFYSKDLKQFNSMIRSLPEKKTISINLKLKNNEKYIKVDFFYQSRFNTVGTIHDITQSMQLELLCEEQKGLMMHQAKLAQYGELLNVITHQWKQPLHALSMWKENLFMEIKDEHLSNDTVEYIEKNMDSNINYLADTIENFNNFYKKSSEKKSFYIKSLIEDTLQLISPLIVHSKILIETFIADDLQLFHYENELKQVVLVLLNNAIDALKTREDHKLIQIKSFKSNKQLVIQITDNGSGISQANKDNIFQKYFTTKKIEGSGIGLYIAKSIIESFYEGDISFFEEDGKTVFQISVGGGRHVQDTLLI